MSIQSVFSRIINGVVTIWDDAETEVNNLVSGVESVLPASVKAEFANDVSAVKQAASNALGKVAAGIGPEEKALVSGAEALLNAYLTAKTGGLAIPLIPAADDVISGGGQLLSDTFTSWALSAQASLAANPAPAAKAS